MIKHLSILLGLIGVCLGISAGVFNQQLLIKEKEYRNNGSQNEIYKLLDERIQISSYAYIGLILLGISLVMKLFSDY